MLQQMQINTKEFDKLTPSELRKLKTVILGHGNKKEFAMTAGVHYRTLGRIALAGSGEKINIEKIRRQLEPAK